MRRLALPTLYVAFSAFMFWFCYVLHPVERPNRDMAAPSDFGAQVE